MYALMDVGI